MKFIPTRFLSLSQVQDYSIPLLPSALLTEDVRQEIAQLLLPPAPVVVDIVAPEVHPGMDALGREDVAHDAVVRRLVLPAALADAEHDFFWL